MALVKSTMVDCFAAMCIVGGVVLAKLPDLMCPIQLCKASLLCSGGAHGAQGKGAKRFTQVRMQLTRSQSMMSLLQHWCACVSRSVRVVKVD